ncbi:MAG: hypothetical protein HC804_04845 [Anaerolineae bacterium]|nr:hypothetical protein [Anaerolineae bacterium]
MSSPLNSTSAGSLLGADRTVVACSVVVPDVVDPTAATADLSLTLLAFFGHETAVVLPLLILLFEISRGWDAQTSKRLFRACLWFIPLLLWLLVWFNVPRTSTRVQINQAETLLQNSAYFAQGTAYSLTWVGGWLRDVQGWNDLVTAVSLSFIALVTAVILQAHCYYRAVLRPLLGVHSAWWRFFASPAAFPWYWIVLTSLPPILILSFGDTINSPRLLTVPGVGIVWLWGNVFVSTWRWAASQPQAQTAVRRWFPRIIGGLLALFCVLLLAQNLRFVSRYMGYHTMMGAAYQEAVQQTVAANEKGGTAVFINLPNELRDHTQTFPLGHEGVMFYVDYLPQPEIIGVQVARPVDMALLRFDDIRPVMPYAYGVMGAGNNWLNIAAKTNSPQIFATRYLTDHIDIVPVGQIDPPLPNTAPLARFVDDSSGDDVNLLDGYVRMEDGQVQVNLIWQKNRLSSPDVNIFVHVINAQGELIAQMDGFAFERTYPIAQWTEGSPFLDIRSMPAPVEDVQVHVGLYNGVTGQRLTAVDANQTIFVDNAVSLPILP